MKAVRVEADGSVAVADLPEPEIGAGEALMATRVAGICGSDLLDWYVRRKAGSVLGHEIAGVIRAVGPGVTDFRVGERVVPHHHAPCLSCAACAAGRFVHCEEWRRSRLDPGGMAELVRIPAGNLARDTLKIPDGALGRGGELHRATRDGRQGVPPCPRLEGAIVARRGARSRGPARDPARPGGGRGQDCRRGPGRLAPRRRLPRAARTP